jgi:hypothetical protein
MNRCLDLEIGSSLATMHSLQELGIPDPDDWTYSPYREVKVRSDGRQGGFGFPSASWMWPTLSQDQLQPFFNLLGDEASAVVYIYTYEDSGRGLVAMRARYKAVMSRPVDGSGKTMVPETRTPVYSDITISFSYMESA